MQQPKQPDLSADAQEWHVESETAKEESQTASLPQVETPVSPDSDGPVTMIQDPFGIPTHRIAEIQQREDDWVDEGIDEEEIQRLTQAMEGEQERQIQALTEMKTEQVQQIADILATQIAEDKLLSAALAEELAEESADADTIMPESIPLDLEEVQSCLEAVLFMSDKPLSLEKLQTMVAPEQPFSIFQEAMTELKARYEKLFHGIELVEIGGGYQFRTKQIRTPWIKKLVKIQTQRLSSGGMETLSIVAYKQPVMKDDIDRIRGVDSSHFIRGLLDRKLIQMSGRSDLPGRPILYTTTDDFLSVFGLKDLAALPPLRELESMMPNSETNNPDDEDPRIKEVRRLVAQMKSDPTRIQYDSKEDEKFLQEIRERVGSIAVSTPSLDAQREAEKAEKMAAAIAAAAPPVPVMPATVVAPEDSVNSVQ